MTSKFRYPGLDSEIRYFYKRNRLRSDFFLLFVRSVNQSLSAVKFVISNNGNGNLADVKTIVMTDKDNDGGCGDMKVTSWQGNRSNNCPSRF